MVDGVVEVVRRQKDGKGYKTISKARNLLRGTVISVITKWKNVPQPRLYEDQAKLKA